VCGGIEVMGKDEKMLLPKPNKELFGSLFFPFSKFEFNTGSRVWVFFAENGRVGPRK
jgi:hypothetical protein